MPTPPARIRNFALVAHVDHGKSTLADRVIELCGAMPARGARAQMLDSMDIERERGITIKAQTVRLRWRDPDDPGGEPLVLNLVDTPGHVDFAYEVSRSLAACEGSLLVVDAAQGVEAQTLAVAYAAAALGHETFAALNKIDLPAAEPARRRAEIERTVGVAGDAVFEVSAKTGAGVEALLDAAARIVPAPEGDADAPLRALVADAWFDPFRGAVALVRVVDGTLRRGERLRLLGSGAEAEAQEVGFFTPRPESVEALGPGEIGHVATGLRRLADLRVGDTAASARAAARGAAPAPLPGFRPPSPAVFCGLFPEEADGHARLREGLERLALNDSSLFFEPEHSAALGPGFRAGFLGLLHMEIVVARLEREFGLSPAATAPTVAHRALLRSGERVPVRFPGELPDPTRVESVEEPWVEATIFAPEEALGAVMRLCTARRGERRDLSFTGGGRAVLTFLLPMSETVFDFHDRLKSATAGLASYDWRFAEWRAGDLVKVSVLVNGDEVEALAFLCARADAERRGRQACVRLKEEIPRQLFKVALQAAIGGRVVARETVSALRKDVTAKCYGGDVTRKRKLLERQKRGKKKMRMVGSVEIPHSAFLAVLKREDLPAAPPAPGRYFLKAKTARIPASPSSSSAAGACSTTKIALHSPSET